MMKLLKNFFYFVLFFLFWTIFFPQAARAEALPAPTLIDAGKSIYTSDSRPLIIGLTKDKTAVQIYVDGTLDGETATLNHPSGTANFAYRPASALSLGWHKVYAVASSSDEISAPSLAIDFKIELPMPAPTMVKAVVNSQSTSSRPFITGLAKNDSKIKVYIDKKLTGEFLVKNHESGTANFAYRPAIALSRGSHQAYSVAVDAHGKTSMKSNAIIFQVKTAAIAEAAEEQKSDAVAEIKEPRPKESARKKSTVISPSTGTVEKSGKGRISSAAEEIKDLLATTTGKAKTSGLVNEEKEAQGRLRTSLIIFISFLVGVIAWLVWVNRELVKERQAQIDAENKNKQDKLL